jgi:hypothetical protein
MLDVMATALPHTKGSCFQPPTLTVGETDFIIELPRLIGPQHDSIPHIGIFALQLGGVSLSLDHDDVTA